MIELRAGKPHYAGSGVIKTGDAELPDRLATIHRGVAELVTQYRPTESAIEKVFVNVNPQSTLLLGQARGAAITALVLGGLGVSEYTALQLKKAVTGHGHADKTQIQAMVRRLLALPADPSEDAADALACALCHLNHRDLTRRLSQGQQAVRLKAGRLV